MRKAIKINDNWKFYADADHLHAEAEIVTLPHTLSLTPQNCSGCINVQTVVVYERELFLPLQDKGKKVILLLNGVMGKARLCLNEKEVALSFCGYTPIAVDLTNEFLYGQNNTLRVYVDNTDDPEVPPGKSQDMLDFTYDGGIYRTASLIVKNPLCITEALLSKTPAGGGVFAWSENVTHETAKVCTKVEIENATATAQSFAVRCTVYQGDTPIASQTAEQTLQPNCQDTVPFAIDVCNPSLWSPETPALYRIVCEILQNDNQVDGVEIPFGIRTFQFTYENGVVWNAQPRCISGANYHQTYPYLGNAVPDNLLRRDVRKLRELGMKNIRSHYPLADAFLDECDRCGITVIVSNPGWQWFQEGIFAQRLLDNMRNIIRWQRNHPCVILWEPIPNESVVPMAFQQQIHNLVHEEYPFGDCYTASDHGPTDVSYRQYDPGMLEPGMEGYTPTKRYGEKSDYPVWIREYNDAPDNWEDQNCAWRTPRQWGDTAMLRAVSRMLGQDPQCPSNHYLEMCKKPNICGYGMWPGIEHNRGYHVNPCWGGLLDMFRLRKFTAEFMDSQQDSSESGYKLFIANWWTDISPEDITVFSNAQEVRLLHDGVVVETRKPEAIDVPHPPFVFKNVRQQYRTRERSTLCAEALVDGVVVATCSQRTPGTPCALKLQADLQNIPFGGDASDIIAVHCSVVDKEGTVVPWSASEHPILFTISENAEIIGDTSIGANPVCPKAGIATILVRSTKSTEEITVSARVLWAQGNARAAIQGDCLTLACVNEGEK